MKKLLLILSLSLVFTNTALAKKAKDSAQLQTKIVGGDAAMPGQFPSTVSLQATFGHMCGGTLVAQDWVLTAGHCVSDPGFLPESIFIGSHDLFDNTSGETFGIKEIIIHPEYALQSDISYDYAMIQLDRPAFGHTVVELFSGDRSSLAFEDLTATGWGSTFEADPHGSNNLLMVEVPYIDDFSCYQMFQENYPGAEDILDESMFCAGLPEGGKDSCQGDSGGPLYYWDSSIQEYIQAGVVSWGFGCAREGSPGVYAEVALAYDWITSIAF